MTQIKQDLLEIVESAMIPEVEAYIEDLHEIIEKKEHTEDTMDEVREMEDFLVELQNIVQAVNENKMDDKQAQEIYDKIERMLEEEGHMQEEEE